MKLTKVEVVSHGVLAKLWMTRWLRFKLMLLLSLMMVNFSVWQVHRWVVCSSLLGLVMSCRWVNVMNWKCCVLWLETFVYMAVVLAIQLLLNVVVSGMFRMLCSLCKVFVIVPFLLGNLSLWQKLLVQLPSPLDLRWCLVRWNCRNRQLSLEGKRKSTISSSRCVSMWIQLDWVMLVQPVASWYLTWRVTHLLGGGPTRKIACKSLRSWTLTLCYTIFDNNLSRSMKTWSWGIVWLICVRLGVWLSLFRNFVDCSCV